MEEKIWFKVRGKWWYIRERSIAWYIVTFFKESYVLFAVLGLFALMVMPVVASAIIADYLGF